MYDNKDYFEIEEEYDFEEVEKMIEQEFENYKNLETNNYHKDFLERLKTEVGKARIEDYADFYGYEIKDNSIIRCGNPEGWCDWFSIGGRWDGSLVDFAEEGHNILRVQDLNLDNPQCLQKPYKVVREYLGDDSIEDMENDDFKKEIDDAITWSEGREEEVYVTIVDMHM